MKSLQIFADSNLGPAAMELLQSGVEPHQLVVPKSRPASILSNPEPDPGIQGADIAFGQPDVESIRNSPALKWLHVSTAGFTRYDTPEFRAMAQERGLVVTNSSRVYASSCAEHTLAFMLAQSRRLPALLQSRAANGDSEWLSLRDSSISLRGQNLVILGYGAIAQELVKYLAPFEMKITAMRRTPKGDEDIPIVAIENLDEVLGAADHVVSILPENSASLNFIDSTTLAKFKKGAVFYNIGRGTTVNQADLLESLQAGHLAAAWLDVTDPEPLPVDHPLRLQANCFISPHTAGGHANESLTLVRHFLENFDRFQSGSPLLDRIM